MSTDETRAPNLVAGVVAVLVIAGLIVWLFATLAKEQIASVALLSLPLTLFALWAVVFYGRADAEH